MISLTGDFARLARLVDALGAHSRGQLPRAILERTAPILAADIRRGFEASRSPQNRRWRRLAQPRGRGRPNRGGPLVDSGELRDLASNVQITRDGFVISIPRPYAARHLYGKGSVPARPYLPRGEKLPAAWQSRLNTAATELWRSVYLGV